MTGNITRSVKLLWLSAWPLWALFIFTSLAVVRFLPAGYARAIVAAPIVLVVPGSLTLGAVFAPRRRPQGTEFVCYATLLSAVWSAFASLGLYACGVLITADSTYLCLLAVSVVLAIAAEARFVFERQGGGRRVAPKLEPADPDISVAEAADADMQPALKGPSYYAIVAAVAGTSLLLGGWYAYDRLPRPTQSGYTSMAWTGHKSEPRSPSVRKARTCLSKSSTISRTRLPFG